MTQLDHVADLLPTPELANSGEDQELRARATLAILFRGSLQENASVEDLPVDHFSCPNCGGPASSTRTPYCSDACKEESGFVRQLRDSIAKGTIADEQRQVALGQKLWRILGGGLPLRVSLIPEKALTRTLTQRGNRCEVCGRPSVTVDNIGSG